MLKIWNFLNGKKTVIGLAVLALCGQNFFSSHVGPDALEALTWLGSILAGGGLIHKAVKGKKAPAGK